MDTRWYVSMLKMSFRLQGNLYIRSYAVSGTNLKRQSNQIAKSDGKAESSTFLQY